MNKIQKKRLYESIMSSTAKVVKRKLNEMATRTNVLADLKQIIDDYSNENNISSIEIKNALDTLNRTWGTSTVSAAKYKSIYDFFKSITIKRLNGLTGYIDKKDFLYLKNYLTGNINLAYYDEDPDNDAAYDQVANINVNKTDKLINVLSTIGQEIENSNNTIFGINNKNVKLLQNAYFNGNDPDDGIYRLFYYLIEGRAYIGADYYEFEDWIDSATSDLLDKKFK